MGISTAFCPILTTIIPISFPDFLAFIGNARTIPSGRSKLLQRLNRFEAANGDHRDTANCAAVRFYTK